MCILLDGRKSKRINEFMETVFETTQFMMVTMLLGEPSSLVAWTRTKMCIIYASLGWFVYYLLLGNHGM